MKVKFYALCLVALTALSAVAQATPLYSNGPVVDGTGKSVRASNASAFGYGFATGSVSLADDFVVAAGSSWNVQSLGFYGYATGATSFSFTSATWSIVSGDVNTGTVVASGVTNVSNGGAVGYRVSASAPGATDRQIYLANADIDDFILDSGSYWLRWSMAGTAGSAWQPPTSDSAAGNGMQAPDGGLYAPVVDGTGNAPELPFLINGALIQADVPEPASLALLAAGLCAIGGLRRKRT